MKETKPTWVNIVEPITINRTENSRLRFSIVKMQDDDAIHVAIREFSKYIKKEEKGCGLRVEDMPYRATTNGLTFKADRLEDVIRVLTELNEQL